MKAAIDVMEQPSKQLVEKTISSDEGALSDAQDDYDVDDDASSSIKKEEPSSEEEETEVIPVKLKRSAPTITEQQNPEKHQVQAHVEKLRVHYKKQKLEGDGNLGIVSLLKSVQEDEGQVKEEARTVSLQDCSQPEHMSPVEEQMTKKRMMNE